MRIPSSGLKGAPRRWSPLAALGALACVACGGQLSSDGAGGSTVGGSGGTSGFGGFAGAGGSAASTTFDVTVLDEKNKPIPGAIVVVDRPDGSRDETTTDPLGIAAFAEVDFAAGAIDITAFSPGRVLVSVLGVEAHSSRVIRLRPPADWSGSTPKLTVKISNKVTSGDCVLISSTAGSWWDIACGDSYQLPLPPGATGQILGTEFTPPIPSWNKPGPQIKASAAVDIPSSGTGVELDFSKSLPIEHAMGSIQIPAPTGGITFEKQLLGVSVTTASSRWPGYAASTTSTAVGSGMVDWQAEYFRPFPDSEARTVYEALGTSDKFTWVSASVSQPGYPGAGVPPPFPIPAFVTSISDTAHSLFAPIDWVAGADRPTHFDVSVQFHLLAEDQAELELWSVWFPPERDSITLRQPPESIWNTFDWKSAGWGTAFLDFCEPGPDACNGSPCTPTEETPCVRSTSSLAASYDFHAK